VEERMHVVTFLRSAFTEKGRRNAESRYWRPRWLVAVRMRFTAGKPGSFASPPFDGFALAANAATSQHNPACYFHFEPIFEYCKQFFHIRNLLADATNIGTY
jgi:hypothetical protein